MKILIEKLNLQEIQTQRGPATKISIGSGGKWYSCFKGQWNSAWREGQEIEVDVEQKEYNGKTYFNIKTPVDAKGGNIQGLLQDLSKKLDLVLQSIEELKKPINNEDQNHIPF